MSGAGRGDGAVAAQGGSAVGETGTAEGGQGPPGGSAVGKGMRARRALEVLAILACFLLIAGINAYLRDDAPGIRWYSGAAGQTVESPVFDITVTSVALADSVSHSSGELASPGVLVVVEWQADVKERRALLGTIELHTASELTLVPRGEFRYSAGPAATDPGFTQHATSVFQVDPADAIGADFVVRHDRGFAYTYGGAVRVQGVVDDSTPRFASVEITDHWVEVTP